MPALLELAPFGAKRALQTLRRGLAHIVSAFFSHITARARTLTMFVGVVALVFVLDACTKALAITYLSASRFTQALPGVFSLILAKNTGAAFSLMPNATPVLIGAFFGAFVVIVSYLYKHPKLPVLVIVSLGFMAGGGLGNALDRIATGGVTDFIYLDFMRFPIFNVADIALTLGFCLLLIFVIQTSLVRKKEHV